MAADPNQTAGLPQPGDLLAGKYRIERLLGRGGMGAVFLAHHEILDRPVAIKLLLPAVTENPEAVRRFLNEGRAAARLHNEHVASVLDVGTLPGGGAYLILEYLEGCDLAHLIADRGPLPPSEVCDYVLQALEALAHAHARGIIHRDLKPANLFLARGPDGLPVVKVLDFGISKAAGTDVVLTQTNSMIGSPCYMSPEQARSSRNVDPRSDIWSVGVVLYQLLTGRMPFTGETFGEVIAAVLEAAPVPLRSHVPEIPPELERVVARCLERAPDGRYSNVAELARALAPFAPAEVRHRVDRIARLVASTQASQASADSPPSQRAPWPGSSRGPAQQRTPWPAASEAASGPVAKAVGAGDATAPSAPMQLASPPRGTSASAPAEARFGDTSEDTEPAHRAQSGQPAAAVEAQSQLADARETTERAAPAQPAAEPARRRLRPAVLVAILLSLAGAALGAAYGLGLFGAASGRDSRAGAPASIRATPRPEAAPEQKATAATSAPPAAAESTSVKREVAGGQEAVSPSTTPLPKAAEATRVPAPAATNKTPKSPPRKAKPASSEDFLDARE